MRNQKTIAIAINVKDRPTELALLLQSLRTQTEQNYDVFILDDGSSTLLTSYSFLTKLISRMRNESHRIHITRNNISKGVSLARQQLVDIVLSEGYHIYLVRIDDDTICEPDYLEKLLKCADAGYDIASGITPPIENPEYERGIEFVEPVINRVVLDQEGKFIVNCDDCGYMYSEFKILPADHFRSSALIKREVFDKVKYEIFLTPCGFREEQFFSFRAIIAGFKIGVHTGAINWHLRTPSGGDRRLDYQDLSMQNQKLLHRHTRLWFKQYGDFIENYHKKLGIKERREDKFKSVDKNSNLIYHLEE